MDNKKRVPIKLLITISVISTVLAVYFGFKTYQASTKISESNARLEEKKVVEDSYIITSKKIDSLILKEEYVAADALLKELKTFKKVHANLDNEVRSKLLDNLMKSKNKNLSAIENAAVNDSVIIKKVESDSLLKQDLVTELKSAKSKIKSLQNQLTKTSENEYLTFKTTKGTELHYVGQVKKHKANGFGIALLETGSRYEGTWKNSLRHGYGKFYWDDGEHYEGSYKNDKRQGQGTYFWKNGEKYVGEWKNDQRNGKGKFYNKKGKIKASGTWENDKLIEENK